MAITFWDLLLSPIYLIVIFIIASSYQKKKIQRNPFYKYYTTGLLVKITGGVALCLVYVFYYGGGDTINYYESSKALLNMAFKDLKVFTSIMLGDNSTENLYFFDDKTGYPVYWKKEGSFFFSRLGVFFCALGCKSIVPMTILLAWACYTGMWKLYLLFCEHFPKISDRLAIAILFIPSVVFWGSGLLKDTVTMSAVGWYAYSFHRFFIKKERISVHFFSFLLSNYLIISIKPYIAFALLPGSLIWLSNEMTSRIQNKLIKHVATPFFISVGILLGYLVLNQLGDSLGLYAVDTVFERAVVVQSDLKKEYYGGNTFDIGDFDASFTSMLSKSHLAIAAALFRPYLWDVRNPVMLISALENTYILFLTLFLLLKLKIFSFFSLIGKNPLLLFSITFSLFFAFSVGITTPNFGSLVRLRIPCIPFYVASLFVLRYLYEQRREQAKINSGKATYATR